MRIRRKYKNAGFPVRFVEAVIRDFERVPEVNEEEENIIPEWLFDKKVDFYVRIPF